MLPLERGQLWMVCYSGLLCMLCVLVDLTGGDADRQGSKTAPSSPPPTDVRYLSGETGVVQGIAPHLAPTCRYLNRGVHSIALWPAFDGYEYSYQC